MDNLLIIVASGKSSRFGCYPKAFCQLKNGTNVENTIRLAKTHFEKIYVVINQETYEAGYGSGLSANVVRIVTGQGDADSLWKALKIVKEENPEAVKAAVCWGDAVFADEIPFREINDYSAGWNDIAPVIVGCCWDEEPYAWFDVCDLKIKQSHFKKEDGICEKGIHDQSLFVVNVNLMLEYLETYKKHLGLDSFDENTYDAARGEMKLLNAFTYFYEQPNMLPAEYRILSANKVKSFNTAEELKKVISELN